MATIVFATLLVALLLRIVESLRDLGVLGRCRRKVWGVDCGDACDVWRLTCAAHRARRDEDPLR